MARFLTIGTQFFDNSGRPLSGGLLNFYESGSTTRKDTYSDADQTIENENPVELDAYGRPPPIFFNGAAKAVLTTSAGVVIQTLDPVGPSITRDAFAAWNSQLTYDQNDIVQGSNSRYYQSIGNDNLGQDPTTTSGYWQEVRFISVWVAGYTYQTGALVVGSNGYVYQGLTADNVGNDPTASPLNWQLVAVDQTNIAITGGTINGAVIGGTTPAAGTFTTLSASSGINSTTLGATTAASVRGTTIEGTSTTEATSTTAAAMKTAGGLGVAKKLYVGDDLHFATTGKGLRFASGKAINSTRAEIAGFLNFGTPVTATIASGVITATQCYMQADTEGAAATDDLVTINGGSTGDILVLRPVNSTRDITLRHGTGNLLLQGDADYTLTGSNTNITFIANGSQWIEISRRT